MRISKYDIPFILKIFSLTSILFFYSFISNFDLSILNKSKNNQVSKTDYIHTTKSKATALSVFKSVRYKDSGSEVKPLELKKNNPLNRTF